MISFFFMDNKYMRNILTQNENSEVCLRWELMFADVQNQTENELRTYIQVMNEIKDFEKLFEESLE